MALTEDELRAIEVRMDAYLRRKRPPPQRRWQLDLGYRIVGQSILLFEDRPSPQGGRHEVPVLKATYVRRHDRWKMYWMRADLRWHRYRPLGAVISLEDLLLELDEDPYGCFWG